jgi:hypothetical protein
MFFGQPLVEPGNSRSVRIKLPPSLPYAAAAAGRMSRILPFGVSAICKNRCSAVARIQHAEFGQCTEMRVPIFTEEAPQTWLMTGTCRIESTLNVIVPGVRFA